MRDLLRERSLANGHSAEEDAAAILGPEPTPSIETGSTAELLEARRDRGLATMAHLLVGTAQLLEPIVSVLSRRLLGWATLIASLGLAVYAMREPRWERLAVLGVFMLLAPWIVKRLG